MLEKDFSDEVETTVDETREQAESTDRQLEKKLLRKLDFKLIRPLFILLLASLIDRVNIGNARLLGLEKDLNLTGNQFNLALFSLEPRPEDTVKCSG
jgi:hypothetical protein